MKYANLEKCTQICERISKLKDKKHLLESAKSKAINVSINWDNSFPIIKEWHDQKPPDDHGSEHGLYHDLMDDFIANLIIRTQGRIEWLESELSKL